jgi:hypothetical protein
VEAYDNPAGRLHKLLQRLNERPGNEAVQAVWAMVLGVQEANVPLHIAGLLQLVDDIQAAVDRAGTTAVNDSIARFRSHWLRAMFPHDYAFNAPVGNVRPGPEALEPLPGIAAYLHALAPDGRVPNNDQRAKLTDLVLDVIGEVEAADQDAVPADVKRLLVTRLMQMRNAIDTVAVGGPEAVRVAAEALAGALATQDRSGWRKLAHRIAATAGISWFMFTAPNIADQSFNTWNQLAGGALHAFVSEFAPRQVPQLPAPAQPALASGANADHAPATGAHDGQPDHERGVDHEPDSDLDEPPQPSQSAEDQPPR